jgi:large subunit ribosomal protein L9
LPPRQAANGKLFGSITNKEVAETIDKAFGTSLDKKKVSLDSEIKGFGTFTAEIKLHAGIVAKVYVNVHQE